MAAAFGIHWFEAITVNKYFIQHRHVTNPQRHPDGNKEGGSYFLKRNDNSPEFDLKNLVKGCDEDFTKCLAQFDLTDFQQNY